jgi:hypothetical protein
MLALFFNSSRLALTFETIHEIDVNPVLIVDGESTAVDANIIFG